MGDFGNEWFKQGVLEISLRRLTKDLSKENPSLTRGTVHIWGVSDETQALFYVPMRRLTYIHVTVLGARAEVEIEIC